MIQIKTIATMIANSETITVREFCSVYIPRYSARMYDLKKLLGISWRFEGDTYYFNQETRQKCKEWLSGEVPDIHAPIKEQLILL